ncbi:MULTISPECIES: hypothetical protein [unclassified Crossiella]|uniref:hypothetical protein n=1 Tax=unclassified Crossiella TaxID=2620835 RepID=UPI001FFF7DF8|nr:MULTISPECIES: hypothetical protein [unclassified Crossiella]MCK2236978.1 hypothetical protein [Crossiella sp. S99.2]MCK2250646.1 hypothetical protein [Crossiella sp. S99.1]
MAGISLTEEQIRQAGQAFVNEAAVIGEQERTVAAGTVDATAAGRTFFADAEAYTTVIDRLRAAVRDSSARASRIGDTLITNAGDYASTEGTNTGHLRAAQ